MEQYIEQSHRDVDIQIDISTIVEPEVYTFRTATHGYHPNTNPPNYRQ